MRLLLFAEVYTDHSLETVSVSRVQPAQQTFFWMCALNFVAKLDSLYCIIYSLSRSETVL